MKMYSIPSKTFLLGEYIALTGGPTLVLCHSPYFELTVKAAPNFALLNIHPQSPAGRLALDNKPALANKQLSFFDPHQGKGGLGGSTAEFLGVYRALFPNHTIEWQTLLNCYWNYTQTKEGQRPSGADIVAQLTDNLCAFDRNQKQLQTYTWPFKELDFLLIRTNQKLATHSHLSQIEDTDRFQSLSAIAERGFKAISQCSSKQFLNAIRDYGEQLNRLGLVAEHTKKMLNELSCLSEVLAVKGCGAMGADIIAIFCDTNNFVSLHQKLNQKKIDVVATSR